MEDRDAQAERARLDGMRGALGDRLACGRRAAGLSQRELGKAIGRVRSTVSRVEAGERTLPSKVWAVADDVCGAKGVLVAESGDLARAERDYRERERAQCRESARAAMLKDAPVAQLGLGGHDAGPDLDSVSGELAEEVLRVLTRVGQMMDRRDAIKLVTWALAAAGLSGVGDDDCVRVAQAVEVPGRVDARVVRCLATTLAQCRRQEDALGPSEVLPTVVAQDGVVRRLLTGCPDEWREPLLVVRSEIASTIGGFWVDLGDHAAAMRYFGAARVAGHDGRNDACSAYAAASMSHAAFLRGETPTTIDMAAAARNLAAGTDDPCLKALAEQRASAGYASVGDYGRCLAAHERAKDLLACGRSAPESLAYWVHDGWLGSQLSASLLRLDRPAEAVRAASDAVDRIDQQYVTLHTFGTIRLGTALVRARDIAEAARVLGDAASLATLSPRHAAEVCAARAGMQPWHRTQAVRALDERLAALGLLPGSPQHSQVILTRRPFDHGS
ncbi:MAG: helix-turn-helix transcriptional regulator [Pseudonocardia sp.]